jgi:hypothetical protein
VIFFFSGTIFEILHAKESPTLWDQQLGGSRNLEMYEFIRTIRLCEVEKDPLKYLVAIK